MRVELFANFEQDSTAYNIMERFSLSCICSRAMLYVTEVFER